MAEQTAVVKFEAFRAVDLSAGVAFANVGQAMEAAQVFAGSTLIPAALQGKQQDVLLVLLKGAELGLKPLQALSEIHIVDGKAGCSAKLKMALCLREPKVCEFFQMTESTPERATYKAKRVGAPDPVTLTYTLEQAQKAGLTGRKNWQAHPAAMLRARASSALADSVFPDLVQGVLESDELREVEERVVGSGKTPLATVAPVIPAPVAVSQPWADDAPRPTPPAEKTVDAAPTESALAVRIGLTATTKDLEALVPEIQKESAATKDALRVAYNKRKGELAAVKR